MFGLLQNQREIAENYLLKFILTASKCNKLFCHRSKNWFLGGPFGGSLGGSGTPKLCQNICLLNICWYQNRLAPKLSRSNNSFLGVHLGGPQGGGTPKLCQNICLLNIYWYHKTLAGTLSWAVQTIDFWGPILGGSRGGGTPNMSKYLSLKYLLISKKKLAP